jgi:hypothetical protein
MLKIGSSEDRFPKSQNVFGSVFPSLYQTVKKSKYPFAFKKMADRTAERKLFQILSLTLLFHPLLPVVGLGQHPFRYPRLDSGPEPLLLVYRPSAQRRLLVVF